MTSFIFSLVFLCCFFNGGSAQTKKMVCPDPSGIEPVKCKETETKISLKIDSGLKSQTELEKIMQKIRDANGVAPDEFLETYKLNFIDLGKSIRTLDLTVLGKIKTQILDIEGKFPRVTIKSPANSWRNFVLRKFYVLNSPGFSPENLDNTLSTFELSKLTLLDLRNSSLSRFPTILSKLAGLQVLSIRREELPRIESGQFRGNPKLDWIEIYDCGLKEIQKDAFDFGPDRNANITNLYISDCPIEDSGIHPNNGLAKLKGEVSVELTYTNVTSLSEKNWKEYLTADKNHFLRMILQPLTCSPAMKWLKMGRKQYEKQVKSAYCKNDMGKTVFESELV